MESVLDSSPTPILPKLISVTTFLSSKRATERRCNGSADFNAWWIADELRETDSLLAAP